MTDTLKRGRNAVGRPAAKILVKVHPKSNKEEIRKIAKNGYEVWVREAPDKGRANEAVIEILSEYLKVPKSKLKLVSGPQSKHKIFGIEA